MGSLVIADVTVPGEVLAITLGGMVTIGIGIASWALLLLVRTTNILTRLEARHEALVERVDYHDELLSSHPEIRRA